MRGAGAEGAPATFAPFGGGAGGLGVVATIPVGTAPELATWNASQGAGGGNVYVANARSGNVSLLSGTGEIGTVNVTAYGFGPDEPIDDPAGPSVLLTYHSYGVTHAVSVLSGPVVHGSQSVSSVSGLTGNDEPELGAYDVSNASVYVTDNGVSVGVLVIGASNLTRYAFVPTGAGSEPRDLAVDPGNGEVYVVDLAPSTITVISGVTPLAQVAVPAPLNSTFPVLNLPYGTFAPDYSSDIAFDPINGDIYVADAGAKEVSVLNRTKVIANVSVGAFPYSVAYDPSDGDVYVTDLLADSVSVLSGTSLVGTVAVGRYPVHAAYDAEDGDILVANLNSSNVSVLNGTTVLGSVPVGTGPVDTIYDTVDHLAYVVNERSDTVSVLSTSTGGGGSGIPPWGWGLIWVLIILILILLIILLSRRRKKKDEPTPAGTPSPTTPPATPVGPPPGSS